MSTSSAEHNQTLSPLGPPLRARVFPRALAITLIYASFAGAWILFSDHALLWFADEAETWVHLSVFKGLLFVLVTSLLLLLLMRWAYGAVADSYERRIEQIRAETQAENERRFSATMIEATPGVLYVFDDHGTFLRWNRNLEIITGRSGEEIARLQPLELIAPQDREAVQASIREVFTHGDSSIEAHLLTREGEALPFFFNGRRVEFDGGPCLIGMGLDLSAHRAEAQARQRIEEELRELNQNLERLVAARTEQLASALSRAESADQLKSAFLATMSHELRTPLNSILGFTGVILQRLAGPLTAEQEKQLEMVRSSARHLLDLINDVLDISKIEAGQLEVRFHALDLCQSLQRVSETIRPFAVKKNLQLEVHIPAELGVIQTDRRRFEQILLNLLSNAVKFTETGTVSLRASRTLPEPTSSAAREQVLITVEDTGLGIAASDLPHLFQPFHQLDSGLTRQHEGTGLGLAICHRLASLLGGSISVESEPRRGSRFTLILPVSPP